MVDATFTAFRMHNCGLWSTKRPPLIRETRLRSGVGISLPPTKRIQAPTCLTCPSSFPPPLVKLTKANFSHFLYLHIEHFYMISPAPLLFLVSVLFYAPSSYASLSSSESGQQHQLQHHDFSTTHSYPEGTTFQEKDGWKRVVVSDLAYKYRNTTIVTKHHHAGHGKESEHRHKHSRGSRIHQRLEDGAADLGPLRGGGVLDAALKAIGKTTTVIITWCVSNPRLSIP